jgi:2,4-dienoyl-CoA reductase-like NADH-dependent reductase (Old Yellow Enzyme family)
MSEEQIWNVIESFAKAAGRARKAGFTGIELHGANTYLLQQFFSPFTNKRADRWGVQTMENRTRFAREVVRAVLNEVGPDYPVAYRVSPEEEEPDGYSTTETIELMKLLVDDGVDIVHVSSWDYGTYLRGDLPERTHPTLTIHEALPAHIPVIGVGSVYHPDQAIRVLDEGVDLVALGRVLLLNADWLVKVRDGREDEITTKLQSEAARDRLEIPDRMKEYSKRFFEVS